MSTGPSSDGLSYVRPRSAAQQAPRPAPLPTDLLESFATAIGGGTVAINSGSAHGTPRGGAGAAVSANTTVATSSSATANPNTMSGRGLSRRNSNAQPLVASGVSGAGAGAAMAVAPATFASSAKDKVITVDSDVRAMAVAGHTVWMAHADGNLSVRKVRTGDCAARLSPYQGRAWCLLTAASTDGLDYVWVGLSNGDIEVYEAVSRTPKALLSRHTGGIYCLAEFSGFVFSGSNDFEVMQWDASRHVFLRQFSGHTNYVRALLAEGGLVVSGGSDATVRVWNVATGKCVAASRGFHSAGVAALCRVGAHVWSGDEGGSIVVWSLETMEAVEVLSEHTGRITALKKVGSRVYSGAGDCEVLVWDALTRRVTARLADHKGWINAICAPAQLARYYVWTAAADGAVQCWHHDEYRVLDNDSARIDEARWFHAAHAPYKDLNQCLSGELTATAARLQALEINYAADTERLRAEGDAARAVAEKALVLEGHLGSANDRFAEKERELTSANAALKLKETELSASNANTMRLTRENGDLKVDAEKLKTEIAELKRRLELTEVQKEVAETAVRRLHGDDAAARVLSPFIVRNESEATLAAARMYKELEDCVRLNESFRDEIIRYKTLLGINSHTPRIGDTAAADAIAARGNGTKKGVGFAAADGAAGATSGQAVPRPPPQQSSASAIPPSDASTRGAVSVGDGYHMRGAHFTGDLKSYVHDRYYGERVLFHSANSSRPLSPRVPSRGNESCRCSGMAPRRLATK